MTQTNRQFPFRVVFRIQFKFNRPMVTHSILNVHQNGIHLPTFLKFIYLLRLTLIFI